MAWTEGLPADVLRGLVPSRWRRVLRLGPARAQWLAEVQRLVEHRRQAQENGADFRRGRSEARQALSEAQGTADKEIRRLQAVIADRLNEPPGVDGCRKVRLHTREEAELFADRLVVDTGEPREVYRAYKCPVCPRHPLTMNRVWHVGHQGKAGREAKAVGEQRARIVTDKVAREGADLRSRVSPAALAHLRSVRNA